MTRRGAAPHRRPDRAVQGYGRTLGCAEPRPNWVSPRVPSSAGVCSQGGPDWALEVWLLGLQGGRSQAVTTSCGCAAQPAGCRGGCCCRRAAAVAAAAPQWCCTAAGAPPGRGGRTAPPLRPPPARCLRTGVGWGVHVHARAGQPRLSTDGGLQGVGAAAHTRGSRHRAPRRRCAPPPRPPSPGRTRAARLQGERRHVALLHQVHVLAPLAGRQQLQALEPPVRRRVNQVEVACGTRGAGSAGPARQPRASAAGAARARARRARSEPEPGRRPATAAARVLRRPARAGDGRPRATHRCPAAHRAPGGS